MSTTHPRRSGAQVLIDQLRIHGADTIFGVPGESYLAALDALYAQRNSIRYVICRQEGGASNMAEAYGKLTGTPGIAFVTRGPGATNASIGLHTGFQDSTPMILLVGQVARETADREAFQEIDYRRMFGQMAKWVVQIEDARRIPELISQAFHRALNGRPGPVVVVLPEDMLTDEVEVADAGPYKIARGAPSAADMASLRAMLDAAKQPTVILGGGGWSGDACADIKNHEPHRQPGAVNLTEVVGWLNKRLPDDVIVTNGAGNYAAFLHRFFQYRGFRTQLAPTSGAMGYGVPAAVAAKIAAPARMVVSFAGDGCFLMNGQEFATAVQHGANVVIVVVDNGMYGTIRMHQEREDPPRVHGTELKNPDFAAYARAFGGHGETVEKTAHFAAAFERAVSAGKPAIIHMKTDPEALT